MTSYSKRGHKKKLIKRVADRVLAVLGYEVSKKGTRDRVQNYDQSFLDILSTFDYDHYTMQSRDNLYAFFQAIKYIEANRIDGDIVECGVWRGGSMMLAAKTLLSMTNTSRELWLYDTFTGMTEPTVLDSDFHGNSAVSLMDQKREHGYVDWCYASIEDVKQNLYAQSYPKEKLHFVVGDVLETIPKKIPDKIALLRLDTDWYESTSQEMKHLYPLLINGGVLIIDDYGTWSGAKKAVDEYFDSIDKKPLLHRIDHTAVIMIK